MEVEVQKLNTKVTVLIVLVVISLFLNLLVLGGGSSSNSNTPKTDVESEEVNTDYDVSDFNEIKASDIANFGKKEIHVVYIGRSTCSWCAQMLPTLKQAQKDYGYTTDYIDIAKIIDFSTYEVTDNNAFTTLTQLDTVEAEEGVMDEFGSTPMMLIIKNNKIIASQVGYSDYDTFTKVLEKGGLKK